MTSTIRRTENDFLRQVIGYEKATAGPKYVGVRDHFFIKPQYKELVINMLNELARSNGLESKDVMLTKQLGKKDEGTRKFTRVFVNISSAIRKHGESDTLERLPEDLAALINLYDGEGKTIYGFTEPIYFDYLCRACKSVQSHRILFVHRYWRDRNPQREAIVRCENCSTIIADEPLDRLNVEIEDSSSHNLI